MSRLSPTSSGSLSGSFRALMTFASACRATFQSSAIDRVSPIFRYLREDKPHGSAGGLYSFRDYIMEDSPVMS
jgi:hypothetical protein